MNYLIIKLIFDYLDLESQIWMSKVCRQTRDLYQNKTKNKEINHKKLLSFVQEYNEYKDLAVRISIDWIIVQCYNSLINWYQDTISVNCHHLPNVGCIHKELVNDVSISLQNLTKIEEKYYRKIKVSSSKLRENSIENHREVCYSKYLKYDGGIDKLLEPKIPFYLKSYLEDQKGPGFLGSIGPRGPTGPIGSRGEIGCIGPIGGPTGEIPEENKVNYLGLITNNFRKTIDLMLAKMIKLCIDKYVKTGNLSYLAQNYYIPKLAGINFPQQWKIIKNGTDFDRELLLPCNWDELSV